MLHTAAQFGYDFSLLRGVLDVNERQREHIDRRTSARWPAVTLAGKRIAVLGLTFKANTDDLRDSPAMSITTDLVEAGADVCAFDPVAGEARRATIARARGRAPTRTRRATAPSVLAILTEWDQFRWLDYTRVVTAMAEPKVVDARNLLDPAAMRRLGFAYQGVGR